MASSSEDTARERAEPEAGAAADSASRSGSPKAPRPDADGASDRIRPIVAEIRERVAELASQELTLRQREQDFEQQYRLLRLEAREVARREWLDAQERVRWRSAELDAQAVELTARGARLEELEQRLALRQAEHERAQQRIAEQLQEMRRQVEVYAREREQDRRRLHERIAIIRGREQVLEQRLAQAQQEAAGRRESAPERRVSSGGPGEGAAREQRGPGARSGEGDAREVEDSPAQRQSMHEQQVALERRRRRLENYDQQLRGRAAALEGEAQRLAEVEAALGQRQAAMEALVAKTEEGLRAAQRRREELLALRDQAEAREGENRQTQLALELERQEVEKERAALQAAREELAGQGRQREVELEHVRSTLAEQALHLRQGQRSRLGGPRRWWLRSGLLAAAVGTFGGIAAWEWVRPVYRAACELRVVGGPAPQDVLWEHERRLRAPGVAEQVLPDVRMRNAWGRARIEPISAAGGAGLQVSFEGSDAGFARGLVEQACAGYRRLAETWPARALAPGPGSRLLAQRDELAQELVKREEERRGQESQLAALPSAEQRDAVRATVGRLRTEYDEVGRGLAEQRGRLSALLSEPPPRGQVSPAELETALAADEMYGEDLREFRAGGVEYRSEVAVAMLLLNDPVRELQRALDHFAEALTEQRELQPPTVVAAALEQIGSDLAGFGETLRAFVPAWTARLEAVQAMVPEQQLVELVKQQQMAAEEAQKLVTESGTLATGIRTRLEQLSQDTDGGTRAVVVGAVVRDELSKLIGAVGGLTKAAEQTDVTKNFRLDALERQVRGLRTRLDRRQAALRQQLQSEADERARVKQAEQVVNLQRAAGKSEERREQVVGELSDQLDELQRMDGQVARRKEIEALIRACDAAIADGQRKIAVIQEQLQADVPDESAAAALKVGAVDVQTVAGAHRLRTAVLAGLGGAAIAFAVCVLSLVQNPLRRRTGWAGILGGRAPAGASTAEEERKQA